MKSVLAVAALSMLLAAPPAYALKTVLTGVSAIDPFYGSANLPIPVPPAGFRQGTKYTVSVQFSRPAIWFNLFYVEVYSFVYCDGRGWCGGDSIDIYLGNIGGRDTSYASGSFVTDKDTHSEWKNWEFTETWDEYYQVFPGYFDNEFAGTDPVGYRIVLDGAVPEPATWALMITGFGLIGASLRTRRRTQVA